jgi:transcription elongation GreA/GreB family factor
MKEIIYNQVLLILASREDTAREAIALAQESKKTDTKSSAGDKFETGRAMIQQEMDKAESQLSKVLEMRQTLSMIDESKKSEEVEFGSLVETDQGTYFISVGIGAFELDLQKYYCISLASPIGKALNGKKEGDIINFQDTKIGILKIH